MAFAIRRFLLPLWKENALRMQGVFAVKSIFLFGMQVPFLRRKNGTDTIYRADLARSMAESSGITVSRMVM